MLRPAARIAAALILLAGTALAHGGAWRPRTPPTPLRPPPGAKTGERTTGSDLPPSWPKDRPKRGAAEGADAPTETPAEFDPGHWIFLNRESVLGLAELRRMRRAARVSGEERPELREAAERRRTEARAAATAALLAAAADADPDLSTGAIVALGRARAAEAEKALLGLAAGEDRDPTVREAALLSLGLLGTGSAKSRERLQAVLDEPERSARERSFAALALGLSGDRAAVAALARRATDAETPGELRAAAAFALGLAGDALALPELRALAGSEDDVLAAHAVAALGRLGGREVREDLVLILESGGIQARRQAALSLGPIPDDASVAALAARIGDGEDPLLRSFAALALAESGRPDAARDLRNAYRRGDPVTAAHAALAMGLLARRTEDEETKESLRRLLLLQLREQRKSSLGGPVAIGVALAGASDAAPRLSEILVGSRTTEARGAAAVALAILGIRDALPTIRSLVRRSQDVGFLSEAARALGLLADPGARPLLEDLLQSEAATDSVRGFAAAALGRLRSTDATETLTGILRDEEVPAAVRAFAAVGLGHALAPEDETRLEDLGARLNHAAATEALLEILGWF